MSFGGAVGAMITSLKNNKRERRSAFKKLENYSESNDLLYFDKNASEQELQQIREKLKKENKIIFIRNTFICLLLLGIMFYLLFF